MKRAGLWALLVLACLGFALVWVWCTLALAYSNAPGVLRVGLAALFAAGSPLAVFRLKKPLYFAGSAALVMLWWTLIPASNDRDWRPDEAVLAEARFEGERVHVKNVRNFLYRTNDDADPRYDDRSYDLRDLESAWYVVVPFQSWAAAAHTFVSFGFRGGRYLGISIEIRKERGETYSALKGMFKQFELIYVLADERDLIGVRANVRKDDVYVYPVRASREEIRRLFVEMVERANALARTPEHYHTFYSSCTTNIVRHVNRIWPGRIPFSLKFLFPGYADRLAYEQGLIDTPLPFEKIREAYRINDRAGKYAQSEDFSERIRDWGSPPAPADK